MMNGTDSLYNLIPQIRRARDYHLYDIQGRRYLDCCLDGGRALLGHKPGRAMLMMKNALDKGLAASYPGVYSNRLLKQLKIFHSGIAGCSVVNDLSKASGLPLFRPFENDGGLIPVDQPFKLLLPLPGSSGVSVVCAVKDCVDALPKADAVPQYLLSGLCRAAAELSAFMITVKPGLWSAFESPLWERKGPWLYSSIAKDRYTMLFSAFLEKGILISPDPEMPSCAPYQFTAGEIVPIKEIEGEFC